MPKLFIIAGCNGAGKTTASYTILPDMLKCDDYVNADEIAKGLCPSNPSSVAIKAGKIMIETILELIAKGQDFGIETTLATKTLAKVILDAKSRGYRVTIVYFWLRMPQLAVERVKLRVQAGGHDVPKDTIIRRFYHSIDNLFRLYLPICDYWMVIDNSNGPSQIIAEGGQSIDTKIFNKTAYNLLLNYERSRDRSNA